MAHQTLETNLLCAAFICAKPLANVKYRSFKGRPFQTLRLFRGGAPLSGLTRLSHLFYG